MIKKLIEKINKFHDFLRASPINFITVLTVSFGIVFLFLFSIEAFLQIAYDPYVDVTDKSFCFVVKILEYY